MCAHNLFRFIRTCLFAMALAGCGGSGSSSDSAIDAEVPNENAGDSKRIVFLGDSITEGYSLPQNEAYPALIGARLTAEGYNYISINAGVSGNTSADALARVGDYLSQPVSVFLIALGINDSRHAVPVPTLKTNLERIIDAVRGKNPGVKIIIAEMPPINAASPDYAASFSAVFDEVSSSKQIAVLPDLLTGIIGDKNLLLADGLHPNNAGQQQIAERVWVSITPLL
jgi:acyl-CoA thioesterase I